MCSKRQSLHSWGEGRKVMPASWRNFRVTLRSIHMAFSLVETSGVRSGIRGILSLPLPLFGPAHMFRSSIMQPPLQLSHSHLSFSVSLKTAPQTDKLWLFEVGIESFLKARNLYIVRKLFPLFKSFKAPDWIGCFPHEHINFVILDHLQGKHSLWFCLGQGAVQTQNAKKGHRTI